MIIKELRDKIDKFEETIVKTVNSNEVEKKHTCNKCDLKFKTKKQLNQHSSKEH